MDDWRWLASPLLFHKFEITLGPTDTQLLTSTYVQIYKNIRIRIWRMNKKNFTKRKKDNKRKAAICFFRRVFL